MTEQLERLKREFYLSKYGQNATSGFEAVTRELQHWEDTEGLRTWYDEFAMFLIKKQK